MTRYLVLEVVDDAHDLTDLVETMAEAGVNRRALISSGGYDLDVRFPRRPLVVALAKDNDPRDPRQLYIEEVR